MRLKISNVFCPHWSTLPKRTSSNRRATASSTTSIYQCGQIWTATVRIKKRTSYKAYSCSSNIIVGKGGGGVVGNRTAARAELQIRLDNWSEKQAPDWSDAKSSSSTTIYGKACEFDAATDLEELQIRKSPDWPNRHLQIQSGAATERSLNRKGCYHGPSGQPSDSQSGQDPESNFWQ